MRTYATGTDTGVGKTVATACLAAAARERGSVLAAKAVASGVQEGPGEDAVLLGFAAGHPPLVHTTLRAPLSPHRAASLEGTAVDVDGLIAWIAAQSADEVLIEGVGGWRVPLRIAPTLDLSSIVRACPGAVVIVAADRLGVLNHTRLTVEALERDGLACLGVVLNRGAAPPDASRDTNLADLRALLPCPVAVLDPVAVTDRAALAAAGSRLWAALRG